VTLLTYKKSESNNTGRIRTTEQKESFCEKTHITFENEVTYFPGFNGKYSDKRVFPPLSLYEQAD